MINKSKLTKYVWFQQSLWEVIDMVSPNKYDDFLVLKQDTNCVHPDGVPAEDIICISCQNDIFYPNTKAVKKAMKEIQEAKDNYLSKKQEFDKQLTAEWLSVFQDYIAP